MKKPTPPLVRLKIATGQWSKGHIFKTMAPNQAAVWKTRGLIEYVRPDGNGGYVVVDLPAAPANRMIGGRNGRGGRITKGQG